MSNLSVTKPHQRRRWFSREFKAEIITQCLAPRASVSRISLDNGLNANVIRRWIKEAQRAGDISSTAPAFVPVSQPTTNAAPTSDKHSTIRIEIPRASGPVVIEWPADQANQCVALLRELLQ